MSLTDANSVEKRSIYTFSIAVRTPSGQSGFTLTEIIVSIAILGVIATIAISADSEDTATTSASADHVSSELEGVRLRAMATRRWHRVTVDDRGGVIDEATTTGMIAPTAYQQINQFSLPRQSVVYAASSSTAIADGASPSDGENLPIEILFGPDGSASAATIFLANRKGGSPIRIAVFASTGYARTYEGW